MAQTPLESGGESFHAGWLSTSVPLGFNRRHSRHRGLLFYWLLQGAVATDPHP